MFGWGWILELDGGVEVKSIGVDWLIGCNCKLCVPLLLVITVIVSPLASVNVIPDWSWDDDPEPVKWL